MENSGISKNFINIIVTYFVWVGCCIVIVSLLVAEIAADVSLPYGEASVTSIVGIVLASVFGFGLAGLGIILSIIGLNAYQQKPEMAKGFGIADFVFIMACLGTMILGAILVTVGLTNSIACATSNPYSYWRANCSIDVRNNIIIIILMLAMAGVSIIGIIGSVKVVSTINKNVPRTGFVSAQPRSTPPAAGSIQPIAATGSQGKFCSACGAPNAADAKFCKSCGKAC